MELRSPLADLLAMCVGDSESSLEETSFALLRVQSCSSSVGKNEQVRGLPSTLECSSRLKVALSAFCFWLPGNIKRYEQLRSLVANGLATTTWPPRWTMATSAAASAAYGNFFFGRLRLEGALWGMSHAEVAAVSPQ